MRYVTVPLFSRNRPKGNKIWNTVKVHGIKLFCVRLEESLYAFLIDIGWTSTRVVWCKKTQSDLIRIKIIFYLRPAAY